MAILDSVFGAVGSRLSRPAGRVLDAPIRDIVHELLKEHGYASPAEVQALRDELRDLRTRVDSLDRRLADLAHSDELARREVLDARAAIDAARQEAATARAEAEAARKDAAERPAAKPAHDPRVDALTARIAELEAALAARPAETPARAPEAPAAKAPEAKAPAAKAPAAPLSAEPRGACKVPECDEAVRSKGFCSAHYQQWRRGTLKSFVNPDGTALVEGRVIHLPEDTVGGLVSVRDGRVYVDGKKVEEVPA